MGLPLREASLWDPPDAVLVDGGIYPIRTDYRAGIAYSMASLDGSLTPQRLLDIWFPSKFCSGPGGCKRFLPARRGCADQQPGRADAILLPCRRRGDFCGIPAGL